MRVSNLLFLAACVAWVLCSCSQRSSAENPEDTNLEKAVGTFAAVDERQEAPTFDSTFTIIEDLTADGEPDSLELRVLGPRMEDPFKWTVRIWVQGELVFEHEVVDSLIDRHFGEPGIWGESGVWGLSGNREQDKAFYYFDELPRRIFQRDQFEAGGAVFDRNSPAGVYLVLARELHERGLVDEQTVQEIIEQVVKRLQAGTVVLSIPISPVRSEFPRIYIAEVGEFVPFIVW
ncbi:MAG: hypothetical protein KAJ42_07500 [Gemmatimonadetes bacterium]|nr:hypothetical protein [Gemmatimonadota bacterium]